MHHFVRMLDLALIWHGAVTLRTSAVLWRPCSVQTTLQHSSTLCCFHKSIIHRFLKFLKLSVISNFLCFSRRRVVCL